MQRFESMIRAVSKRSRRSLTVVLLVGAGAFSVEACARNPVTGERELVLVSESQEIQIGRQGAQEVVQTLGLVDNPALQAYVSRLGKRLAAVSERPDLPWEFGVVEDPTPNAFALPGGYIFFTRGMLSLMDSEAELATVLGHEIGHVTARHSVQQITRQQLGGLALGVGMILFPQAQPLGNVFGTGLNVLLLRYGRDAERQADELGFKYALTERFDVREMADVFVSLLRLGEREQRSPLPSFLQSHPLPQERVETARERAAALEQPAVEALRLGRAEYMAAIEGLVYGDNPRNGFFEQGVFFHPDLRFRMRFPAQWRTQNLPNVVAALSPQNDAVAQLELAQANSAAEGLRQFSALEGVQVANARQERIGGLPAVVAYFQAQSQQGTAAGIVSYIDYGGRVYRILGYSPAQAFGRYETVIRQVIASFAPVTDPAVLNVQPNRITIVRLDRAMSLATFNQRFPSVIPLEDLVIINQAASAQAVLPAGTLVKRVVGSGR